MKKNWRPLISVTWLHPSPIPSKGTRKNSKNVISYFKKCPEVPGGFFSFSSGHLPACPEESCYVNPPTEQGGCSVFFSIRLRYDVIAATCGETRSNTNFSSSSKALRSKSWGKVKTEPNPASGKQNANFLSRLFFCINLMNCEQSGGINNHSGVPPE